jgi:hypothetical protein
MSFQTPSGMDPGSYDSLISQAEEANRNIKKLVKFMTDKAALDLDYGRQLQKLASKVHLERAHTPPGTPSVTISSNLTI